MYQPFEDATFQWGQAGLPGTGITAGEKASINSRLTGIEADLVSEYYTQSEVDAMIAAAQPIPFVCNNSIRIATTSITDITWMATSPIAAPAGTYRAVGVAVMPMARSVTTGGMLPAVRIGGSVQEGQAITMGTNGWGPLLANEFFTVGVAFNLTFTKDGSDTWPEYGVRGGTTAGTTYLHRPHMYGTLTRIG